MFWINLWRQSDASIYQWIRSILVQTMACHLFNTKPLSKPNADLLAIRTLQISFSSILIERKRILLRKMHLKVPSVKSQPFCLIANELLCSNSMSALLCEWPGFASDIRLRDIIPASNCTPTPPPPHPPPPPTPPTPPPPPPPPPHLPIVKIQNST